MTPSGRHALLPAVGARVTVVSGPDVDEAGTVVGTRDVPSFEAALTSSNVAVMRTDAKHLAPSQFGARTFDLVARATDATKHSGNTVSLESELANLGEVRSQHSAVTGIVSAFHRMLLSSVKG